MITNFENITYELTDVEKELLPILIKGLSKITEKNPMKAPEIIDAINKKYGKSITQPRLRKLVNYIRAKSKLPIIATSKGYYVSYNKEVLQSQVKSLEERADAIYHASNGLRFFLKSDIFFNK